MVLVATVRVTFLPLTTKVFFCRFGLKTRLVWRIEKLTLLPNCLPLPVISHRDAIMVTPFFQKLRYIIYVLSLLVKCSASKITSIFGTIGQWILILPIYLSY